MSNANQTNLNVECWFFSHCLPWSDEIVKKLDNLAIGFVEDLKLIKLAAVANLSNGQKEIAKARAELAFHALGGRGDFDFKKVATKNPVDTSSCIKVCQSKFNT